MANSKKYYDPYFASQGKERGGSMYSESSDIGGNVSGVGKSSSARGGAYTRGGKSGMGGGAVSKGVVKGQARQTGRTSKRRR